MNFRNLIALVVGALISQMAQAQDPAVPKFLTFPIWKDQQVLEAQNQVLRSQSRLTQMRAGKGRGTQEPAEIPTSSKLKKLSDNESLTAAEQDLKRAQDALDSAQKLSFEDYVDIYVPTLQDQPEALQKLSEKLTKEELTEIFKALMRKSKDSNAARNAALMGDLSLSARSKTP